MGPPTAPRDYPAPRMEPTMSDAFVATRRALIRSAAAGAALAATSARAAAPGADLADPAQALRASRRLDAALRDGAPTLFVGAGTLYAAPDPERDALPMLNLAVVETSSAWGLSDGRYALARKRLLLFTALGSDAPAVSFKNPFNGLLCRPFSTVETVHEVVTGDEAAAADRRAQWAWRDGRIVRTETGVEERPHPLDPVAWPHQSSGPRLRRRHVATSSADAALLAGASELRVDTVVQEAAPWLPWMLMGASHGGVVIETRTRTARSLAGLERELADLVERDFAEALTAPTRQAAGRDDAYARYGRSGQPLIIGPAAVA